MQKFDQTTYGNKKLYIFKKKRAEKCIYVRLVAKNSPPGGAGGALLGVSSAEGVRSLMLDPLESPRDFLQTCVKPWHLCEKENTKETQTLSYFFQINSNNVEYYRRLKFEKNRKKTNKFVWKIKKFVY